MSPLPHIPVLAQGPIYAAALRARACDVVDVAGVQAIKRRIGPVRFCYIPRALPDFTALRAGIGERSVIMCNAPSAASDIAFRRAGFVPVITPQHHAIWDIRAEPAQLREGMDQKWRNRLHAGERAGLTVVETPMPPDVNHWLLRAEAVQAARRGYRGTSAMIVPAIAAIDPGATRLLVAKRGAQVVAAMLFVVHGTGATYQIGWCDDMGRRHDAPRVLMWRAVLWLRSKGVEAVDLGSVETEKSAGLARFKCGTGAKVHSLGHTFIGVFMARRLLRPLTLAFWRDAV